MTAEKPDHQHAITILNYGDQTVVIGLDNDSKPANNPRKIASGQKEMLMPIAGKKPAKEAAAKKPVAKPQRKSA